MKTVVILQSNYIPWKGYFDLMHEADEFILFDNMQYTRRDWRNRNQIKTAQGAQWLTIPVEVKGKYDQRIDQTLIAEPDWASKHWQTLRRHYAKALHFREYASSIEALYEAASKEVHLSRINRLFLEGIGRLLGIDTPLSWSTDYPESLGKTERLVALCQAAAADHYISGPAARDYIQPEFFSTAGIALSFKDYSGYPEHPQLHPPFSHAVTVLDLLFNVGEQAPWYIWGWREGKPSL
jgi:hypothetical protein